MKDNKQIVSPRTNRAEEIWLNHPRGLLDKLDGWTDRTGKQLLSLNYIFRNNERDESSNSNQRNNNIRTLLQNLN